jgi:hypothetical protein
MATFITSKAVGQDININVNTSTGFWKYNHDGSDSSVIDQNNGSQTITVENVNGEFTIISCLSNGTVSGDVIQLWLYNNQLTSFDGTGLGSLANLGLSINQLTSFDGTGLSGLTGLELDRNLLASFDVTGLPSLNYLDLYSNQLTSFDGTGLGSLVYLDLHDNQLTSFDVTGLVSLTNLYLVDNQLTPSSNNQILNQLNQNGLSNGEWITSGGRTSASNTDYDNLVSLGWGFYGLDLIIPPTFITSKSVGETIDISVQTSTVYWKYNHDGSDSSVFGNGQQSITITNANGEFTIISCDLDGTVSGDVTYLYLSNNQLTSFDGTDLSSLTVLGLTNNQLTSFDGTDLTSLTTLFLNNNQLTSFDGTGLTSLTALYLQSNQLTSSVNNQILNQLNQNGLSNGEFYSSNGRTSASNTDYDNLISLGWTLSGLDLPVVGSGKLRVKGVNSGGGTTTTTTTMAPPSSQATNFLIKSVSLAGSTLQALTEFRLANPLVDGYLVTMDDLSDPIYGNGANSLSNSVLSIVNGTSYSIGDTIGINTFNSQPNGTIVKVGPATNVSIIDGFDCEVFTIPNIQGGQNGHTFEFNVYAYNLDSNGSPVYNINDPLTTALVVQQTGGGKGGQGKKTKGE